MSLISLSTAKQHLRVDHDDDDEQISLYLEAAEVTVSEYIDRAIYGAAPPTGDDGTAIALNAPIRAAILLLLGKLYEFREAGQTEPGDAVLPQPIRALLAPYRIWRTQSDGE